MRQTADKMDERCTVPRRHSHSTFETNVDDEYRIPWTGIVHDRETSHWPFRWMVDGWWTRQKRKRRGGCDLEHVRSESTRSRRPIRGRPAMTRISESAPSESQPSSQASSGPLHLLATTMTSFIIQAHERRQIPPSWKQDSTCTFCSIIRGQSPAFKVYEDELVIAVLGELCIQHNSPECYLIAYHTVTLQISFP